jgi:hypothetical protein
MIEIPKEFQPEQRNAYPSYCTSDMMEQYVAKNLVTDGIERIYLPIYWTNYYVQNDYGKGNISPLYRFLDSLDKNKKYFTCVQYDDGILEMPSDLDLMVFSSGHPSGVSLPLLPSHYLDKPVTDKRYDLTFIGNAGNHPIRSEAISYTSCWHFDGLSSHEYYKVLAQSEFALCPRGYGVTSFRLYEALHCGAVPIYVSDVHWLPYSRVIDWNKIAIIIKPEEIHTTREQMANHVQDWDYYEEYKGLFTIQGVAQYIEGFLKGTERLEKDTHKAWHQ